jgi:GNAT superfamily N-acetyltransferase
VRARTRCDRSRPSPPSHGLQQRSPGRRPSTDDRLGTLVGMPNHQVVRLADRLDAVDIVARWDFEEWGSGPEELGLEATKRRFTSWATNGGVPCAYVAVVDNEVCGSASLVDHDMSYPPEGIEDLRPWLSGVYVKPERRRTGLGPALVAAVGQAAKGLGYPRLYLFTGVVTAVKFYAPMGWEAILTPWYEGKEVVVMEKVL